MGSGAKDKTPGNTVWRLLLLVVVKGSSILRLPPAGAHDIGYSTSLASGPSSDDGAKNNNSLRQRGFYERNHRVKRLKKRGQQREMRQQLLQRDAEKEDQRGPEDAERRVLNSLSSSSTKRDPQIFVNSEIGDDSENGSTPSKAVKTLKRALQLVGTFKRPLENNLVVELTGTFEMGERLVLTEAHRGTSKDKRVVFRGGTGGAGAARVLGGRPLQFVPGAFRMF